MELEWMTMPEQPGNIAVVEATHDDELAVCGHTCHLGNHPRNSVSIAPRLVSDRHSARSTAPRDGHLVSVEMNARPHFSQEISKRHKSLSGSPARTRLEDGTTGRRKSFERLDFDNAYTTLNELYES